MFPVKFVIMARKPNGEEFECFRWCREAAQGIERGWADAKRFGVEVVEVWAVPVEGAA